MSTRTIVLTGLLAAAVSGAAEAQYAYTTYYGGPASYGGTTAYYGGTGSAFAYRPAPFRATRLAAPYTSPLDPLGWFSPASPLGVINPFNYTAGYYGGYTPAVSTTVGFGPGVSYGVGTTVGFGGGCGCGTVSPCGAGGCGTGSCGASYTPADVPLDDPIDDGQRDEFGGEPIRERTFDSDPAPYEPETRPDFGRSRGTGDEFGDFRREPPTDPVTPPAGSGTRDEPVLDPGFDRGFAPPTDRGFESTPADRGFESSPPADPGFGPERPLEPLEDDGFGGGFGLGGSGGGDSFGGGFGDSDSGSSSSFRFPSGGRGPTDAPEAGPIDADTIPEGDAIDGVPPLRAPDSARGAIDRMLARATAVGSSPAPVIVRSARSTAFGLPVVARAEPAGRGPLAPIGIASR